MGRPPSPNPSPEALRKRKQRQRQADRLDAMCEAAPLPPRAGIDRNPMAWWVNRGTSRLVLEPVWVPKGDEKAIQFAASRLRKAARIPESEVPE